MLRLALAMGKQVAELLEEMTSSEWIEWRAYFELEPFGPAQDDFRTALICNTVANAGGMKKESGGKFSVPDFIHRSTIGIDEEKQRQAQKDYAVLKAELARIEASKIRRENGHV